MSTTVAPTDAVSWWQEPTKDQWYAYLAAWLGWTLDAFDFTIFLLIMVPISKEFGVPLVSVLAVFTVTLWLRLLGATASGWLADRVGRKTPLMISILGYSLCNFIAGFSPTFTFLFVCRAALGIFMGANGLRAPPWRWSPGRPALARLHERHAARLLGTRLSAFERDLWGVLQRLGMARHAVGRHPSGACGSLCAQVRQRARGLEAEPRKRSAARMPSSARRCWRSSDCGCCPIR